MFQKNVKLSVSLLVALALGFVSFFVSNTSAEEIGPMDGPGSEISMIKFGCSSATIERVSGLTDTINYDGSSIGINEDPTQIKFWTDPNCFQFDLNAHSPVNQWKSVMQLDGLGNDGILSYDWDVYNNPIPNQWRPALVFWGGISECHACNFWYSKSARSEDVQCPGICKPN